MKRILFSPLGTTDPISNFHDGSMLHICRYYKPDIVYLYMTKQVHEFHILDNRYCSSLIKLGEHINHTFEIHIIADTNIDDDVILFDLFLSKFSNYIEDIISNRIEEELIVNVSSGTPAMKSALQSLAVFLDYKLLPIQVLTPLKSYNPHSENKEKDDYNLYWDLNEDNLEGSLNRCIVSSNRNLLMELHMKMLGVLINNYNYVGARSLIDSMNNVNDRIKNIITGACYRIQLDHVNAKKYLNLANASDILSKSKQFIVVEYILWLQIKIIRNEYSDFARGVTPVFVKLLEQALIHKKNINILHYTKRRPRDGASVWDKRKIEGTTPGQNVKRILESKYDNFDFGIVKSIHLINILEELLSEDDTLLMRIKEFRCYEEKLRNIAAHELTPITKKEVVNLTGNTPDVIFSCLKSIVQGVGISITDAEWNSYQTLNEHIMDLLRSSL